MAQGDGGSRNGDAPGAVADTGDGTGGTLGTGTGSGDAAGAVTDTGDGTGGTLGGGGGTAGGAGGSDEVAEGMSEAGRNPAGPSEG